MDIFDEEILNFWRNLEGGCVPFLHINQLIATKKAVNRPKDQIDVQALEEIIKLRGEE